MKIRTVGHSVLICVRIGPKKDLKLDPKLKAAGTMYAVYFGQILNLSSLGLGFNLALPTQDSIFQTRVDSSCNSKKKVTV